MMATPHHLHMINNYHHRSPADKAVFTLFSSLPTELRLQIWKQAISKQRLIELEIAPDEEGSQHEYQVSVRSHFQLHSKLLRVNREARHFALSFYRIHIPCIFPTGLNKAPVTSPLYLNPEHDILHLHITHPAQHTFVPFLHDLKSHDPHHIGLLRLALDPNSTAAIHSVLSPPSHDDIPAHFKATLTSTLTNLTDLIWTIHSPLGRPILGPLLGFPDAGIRFNHSMPLKPLTSSFDLYGRDPRDATQVEKDLQYVLGWKDPRGMRAQWREVLRALGIVPPKPVRERVLFAHEAESYREGVVDVETAERYLREEDASWKRSQVERELWFKRYAKVPVETDEELERVARPAVGFWLFEAEAVGELEGNLDGWKKTFDLRGWWPELGVARLV